MESVVPCTNRNAPLPKPIILDGNSLDCNMVFALARRGSCIAVSEETYQQVQRSRKVVEEMLVHKTVAYGINTGFGLFSDVIIAPDKLEQLQLNVVRSHCAGVGEPLSFERSKMLLALRINVLCRGNSGITVETLKRMVHAFNNDCISVVPSQGSVGASGDLAPLAHLALGLLGEGYMWWHDEKYGWQKRPACDVMSSLGVECLQLRAKEGLALVNGTQMMTALGCEAVVRSKNIQRVADVVAALSLEVLKGTINAFHPRIHERRPHKGQQIVASRLRSFLCPSNPSTLCLSHEHCGRVQDAYSLRCTPQVHGVVLDTIDFVESIIETEVNSSGDNPMVFAESPEVEAVVQGNKAHSWLPPKNGLSEKASTHTAENIDVEITNLDSAKDEIKRLRRELMDRSSLGDKNPRDTFYSRDGTGYIISGGNFHGEYPAKALDYLAIGISELATISERRIERMVNPTLSGLPAFLVKQGGLNSGFMIAHCTAAALVSENKVLVHPASCDSIPTSSAKEDHVSMGNMASRKVLSVIWNVERVLAIELLAACQALEFHRPLKTTPGLEAVVSLVRERCPPLLVDRVMKEDIDAVTELVMDGEVWARASAFI